MDKIFALQKHPKQVIKGLHLERIHNLINEQKDIIFYVLLCPTYPNDGSKFTYASGDIKGELPHNYGAFEQKIDQHINHIYNIKEGLGKNGDEKKIIIKPLVCEIEKDMPHVIDKFAHGSLDLFESKVIHISELVGNQLAQRYKNLNISVQSGIFNSINDLEKHQETIDKKITDGRIPQSFIQKTYEIAQERSFMFENLYGATNMTEKLELSIRQMKNYLAVTLGISLQDPGCFIINAKTPNRYYVEHPEAHTTLGVPKEEIALYSFLN